MKFRIPFTLTSIERQKNTSRFFMIKKGIEKSPLQEALDDANLDLTAEEYRAIARKRFITSFLVLYVLASTILVVMKIEKAFLISLGVVAISLLIYTSQVIYPGLYIKRRIRDIEKNLIPALQDIVVQLNAGIPLFNLLANIANSDYGILSEEFAKAAKKINAGFPQIEVLEELGERNPSIFFKRALWQISNGMRAGSDIAVIIQESIKSLTQEQILQIQNYGNKLNPLIMFYLLTSVILPALSITFLTIISSMIGLEKIIIVILFISIASFVIIIQMMFLGVVKSIRPSLL